MAKLDLKKEYRHLYNPSSKECSIVDVPELQFLMVDGAGDPNTSVAYTEAVEALYAMSYTLKFISKQESVDYTVMPLEGLWWTPNLAEFSMEDKSAWEWTALMAQPEHITADLVTSAAEEVRRKKNPAALDRVRFELWSDVETAPDRSSWAPVGLWQKKATNSRSVSRRMTLRGI